MRNFISKSKDKTGKRVALYATGIFCYLYSQSNHFYIARIINNVNLLPAKQIHDKTFS